MAHYLLSVLGPTEYDEFYGYDSAEQRAATMADVDAFNDRLRAEGRLVYLAGLAPAAESAVVDAREGTPLIMDGPFAEFKEWLNGLWIVDAADHDEALALAADGSRACGRRIEVRAMLADPDA